MRMHPFHRTELLVGQDGFSRLTEASCCVIGLGGVGSFAVEALVRSGIGHLTLVDFDKVCITNVNRQLMALRSTVGQPKAELMGERARAINPKADIRVIPEFYCPENRDAILDRPYDYVLDCIDNMTAKVDLLHTCVTRSQPVFSSMGAGGKLDPTRVRVTDLSKTFNDRFAAIVRDLLRQKGISEGIECVWTDESSADLDPFVQANFRCICPDKDSNQVHGCESRLQVQGSTAWMPAIFGMTLAGAVVNRILERPIWSTLPNTGRDRRDKPFVGKLSRKRKKELMAQRSVELK